MRTYLTECGYDHNERQHRTLEATDQLPLRHLHRPSVHKEITVTLTRLCVVTEKAQQPSCTAEGSAVRETGVSAAPRTVRSRLLRQLY